jgi:mono/diheme cytochrome c family protein
MPRHEKIDSVISLLKFSCTVLFVAVVCFAALPAHALFGSKTNAAEQAGALLFRDKGCAYCHGAGGTGGKKGPALTDLRKNKLWTPAKMTDQIMNGGQKMPPFHESVSDEEAAQLVAWLRAKHRPVAPEAAATK